MNNQERITSDLEKLIELSPKWSKAKSDKNYSDEMRKVTLNLCKAKSEEKTSARREEEAYASPEYKDYLWKAFNVDLVYFKLDGEKNLLEKSIDAHRSLLSFSKFLQEKTL